MRLLFLSDATREPEVRKEKIREPRRSGQAAQAKAVLTRDDWIRISVFILGGVMFVALMIMLVIVLLELINIIFCSLIALVLLPFPDPPTFIPFDFDTFSPANISILGETTPFGVAFRAFRRHVQSLNNPYDTVPEDLKQNLTELLERYQEASGRFTSLVKHVQSEIDWIKNTMEDTPPELNELKGTLDFISHQYLWKKIKFLFS